MFSIGHMVLLLDFIDVFHWAEDMWSLEVEKGRELDTWRPHLSSLENMRRLAAPLPLEYDNYNF